MTAGVALATTAGAQTPPSTDASLRSLSFESDLGQTRMFPAFDPAVDRYDVAVPSGETEVTVKVATNHSGASVVLESTREGRCCIEELDHDANTDAHTLQLRTEGHTYMTVKVTAEDGSTTRKYGVYVDVASSDALGWRVYNDVPMDRLVDDPLLPSHYVHGVWADGSRVLTTAERHGSFEGKFILDQKLYAFDAADSSRQTAEEFVLGGRPNAGIWSDGTTLWAMSRDGTLNAYSLSGGEGERGTRVHDDGSAHVTALPLEGKSTDVRFRPSGNYDTRDVDAPRGIWSDGDTLWVVDHDNAKVVAFALPTKCGSGNNYCRRSAMDFELAADNDEPWGITAGSSTLPGPVDTWWVTNVTEDRTSGRTLDKRLFAYVYSEDSDINGTRIEARDIDLKETLNLPSYQQFFYGLAATDTIMYVAEFITGRVYSFNMPGVSGPVAPGQASNNPGTSNPGTSNPGTSNPGTSNPGTSNPGTSNPGTSNPGTSNPGTSNPGTSNPGTSNPGGGSSNTGSSTVGESSGDESDSDSESDDFTPLDDAGDAGTDIEAAINALHRLGVFTGALCQSNRLCPNDPLQRWIAAVWLVRLIDGDDPPAVTESRFADVNASSACGRRASGSRPHVERLADLEITVGCTEDPLKFCPDVNLTRAQVASWVARAFDLESDESQGFVDAVGSVHEANINAVVAAGVMSGCSTSPKNFCLTDTVTKGEMARYVYAARNVSLGRS